jgi:hypothetical protein
MRYHENGIYAYDIDKTVDRVTELFQSDTETHGFVKRIEIDGRAKNNSIKVTRRGGEIIAAIDFNHGKREPHTTVYNLAVDDRFAGEGHRENLLYRVLDESPHDRIITKVPADVAQNRFWREHGSLRWVEQGRKRPLNVYTVNNTNGQKGVTEW